MQIYGNKRNCLHEKRVQLPTDQCLEHQHGRRFIVLRHQYGRRDVMWKKLHIELKSSAQGLWFEFDEETLEALH